MKLSQVSPRYSSYPSKFIINHIVTLPMSDFSTTSPNTVHCFPFFKSLCRWSEYSGYTVTTQSHTPTDHWNQLYSDTPGLFSSYHWGMCRPDAAVMHTRAYNPLELAGSAHCTIYTKLQEEAVFDKWRKGCICFKKLAQPTVWIRLAVQLQPR